MHAAARSALDALSGYRGAPLREALVIEVSTLEHGQHRRDIAQHVGRPPVGAVLDTVLATLQPDRLAVIASQAASQSPDCTITGDRRRVSDDDMQDEEHERYREQSGHASDGPGVGACSRWVVKVRELVCELAEQGLVLGICRIAADEQMWLAARQRQDLLPVLSVSESFRFGHSPGTRASIRSTRTRRCASL